MSARRLRGAAVFSAVQAGVSDVDPAWRLTAPPSARRHPRGQPRQWPPVQAASRRMRAVATGPRGAP
ncbi:hypothetical protein EIB18_14420 [Caulobacter vibrioides]|uniref:Uncharacterized protein n=1 Tax=Caulobacter vibrioides (strain NA1000 / CB15N) TaxID=565050 RepID=A0A0H3CBK0_CAUVN|nr:hypothetical protein [Caulobacter vibrioides]YP_002518177.1 hypothetical protein CCNA_02804 [Caulobacter vibrioides NA1000]QBQ57306.1 hypothetical protein EUX21_02940 [synthetic Caulobacter sp. 'ethensis']ACL96269.1 hypothetical protein CCNA_02804 [Caulobacter vibrioides NA1000]ATC29557.1 hypothetical protein CA607_14695 [Caulobacter vibrioides]AZH13788.1 hypothetical protein EIB18_14420 [Caulobacter vibrioides]QXZ51075.1 hypothetical protein KZH45_14445 [Caulobacter vibrioides]